MATYNTAGTQQKTNTLISPSCSFKPRLFAACIEAEYGHSDEAMHIDQPYIDQATTRPATKLPPSYHQATTKLRPSYDQATTKLRPSYDQATTKLRPSYDQATTKLRPSYTSKIFERFITLVYKIDLKLLEE